MDEEAAFSRIIQTLAEAVKTLNSNFVCGICLEYFKEPVTIKCTHSFCHQCILKVADTKNASCPICKSKIQKRSIPREENRVLKDCVKQNQILVEAIQKDIGIDILRYSDQPENTKESSAPVSEKPKTFHTHVFPSTSKENNSAAKPVLIKGTPSVRKRVSLNKKFGSSKKVADSKPLDKYLKSTSQTVNEGSSQEKVENWLKNVSETHESLDNDYLQKSHALKAFVHLEDNLNDSQTCQKNENLPKNILSEKNKGTEQNRFNEENEESKYKDTHTRIQEIDMNAKNKKTNQTLSSKAVLKTPVSVPAASHSDAYDWKRVKRYGREMQINTFKSLNVSKEKSSSSITSDNIIPYSTNSIKNTSREAKCNEKITKEKPVIESKSKKSFKLSNDSEQENRKYLNQKYESRSLELGNFSSDLQSDNEIIGILPAENLDAPELMRTTSYKDTKLKRLTPLKTAKSDTSDNESSATGSPPPTRPKLSLKLKNRSGTKSTDSSFTRSNQTIPVIETPNVSLAEKKKYHKDQQGVIENPKVCSPEKKKSKFEANSHKDNQLKSLLKDESNEDIPKNKYDFSVAFVKKGRICVKKKNVPFLNLGSVKPKLNSPKQQNNGIIIKSVEPVNIERTSGIGLAFSRHKNYETTKVVEESMEISACHDQLDFREKISSVKDEVTTNATFNKIKCNRSFKCKSNIQESDNKIEKKNSENSRSKSTSCSNLEDQIFQISNKDKQQEKNLVSVLENNANIRCNDLPIEKSLNSSSSSDSSKTSNDSNASNNSKTSKTKQSDLKFIKSTNSSNKELFVPGIEMPIIESKTKNEEDEKIIEINSDSDSPFQYSKIKHKNKSCISSVSTTSSVKSTLSNKKRSHLESSEDDDVDSIIGKWCQDVSEPTLKKPKMTPDFIESSQNKVKKVTNDSESLIPIKEDSTLKEDSKLGKNNESCSDSVDVNSIEHAQNYKQNQIDTNTINKLQNSLMSNDIFDTNDQNISMIHHVPAKIKKTCVEDDDESSSDSWSPTDLINKSKNRSAKNKEITVVESVQFRKNEFDDAKFSDGSNKENKVRNYEVSPKKSLESVDIIGSSQDNKKKSKNQFTNNSQINTFHVPESLLNVTEDEMALKQIEKNLFGVDSPGLPNINPIQDKNNFATTPSKKGESENVFDSEIIGPTPILKKKLSKSDTNFSQPLSPGKIPNLIPAITPVRNTKSYPLCHSTPMITIESKGKTLDAHARKSNDSQQFINKRKLILVCSGLPLNDTKVVREFSNSFNSKLQTHFSPDVTHVIVQTEPETKAGQKTFKYIQGIAYQKYVVSFSWITDCLSQGKLLNEDDEKYEVLDPDVHISGTKRSRLRTQDLYSGFAFFCYESFTSFSSSDFEDILRINGGVIARSCKELSQVRNKHKIILLDSENLSQERLSTLNRAEIVLVSFEWVVDSLSQYQMLSLVPYLCETTVAEAQASGIPPGLLTEEEEYEEEDAEMESS